MFQFALPHGERRVRTALLRDLGKFQFALPHGERQCLLLSLSGRYRFNSRSRMGKRPSSWSITGVLLLFQFALPHGERHPQSRHNARMGSFNSRSRMGSDYRHRPAPHAPSGFNSRSRMGSDPEPPCQAETAFQFALPHGERRKCPNWAMIFCSFNSRSRMGSDH